MHRDFYKCYKNTSQWDLKKKIQNQVCFDNTPLIQTNQVIQQRKQTVADRLFGQEIIFLVRL